MRAKVQELADERLAQARALAETTAKRHDEELAAAKEKLRQAIRRGVEAQIQAASAAEATLSELKREHTHQLALQNSEHMHELAAQKKELPEKMAQQHKAAEQAAAEATRGLEMLSKQHALELSALNRALGTAKGDPRAEQTNSTAAELRHLQAEYEEKLEQSHILLAKAEKQSETRQTEAHSEKHPSDLDDKDAPGLRRQVERLRAREAKQIETHKAELAELQEAHATKLRQAIQRGVRSQHEERAKYEAKERAALLEVIPHLLLRSVTHLVVGVGVIVVVGACYSLLTVQFCRRFKSSATRLQNTLCN